MSADSLIYRNAFVIVNGSSLAGQFTELTVNMKAEILDRTVINEGTRNHRGGLLMADMGGKGLISYGTGNVEDILFNLVGVGDTPVVIFPDGIVEGSQVARGFAMMAVVDTYNMHGMAGAQMNFDFAAQSAGLGY